LGSDSVDEGRVAERVVAAMMAKDTFSQWLGIRVVTVQPRSVTIEMTVRDDMLNGFGVCHGGVAFSLADSALAFASNTHGRVTMSIENTIAYPKGIVPGDTLTAIAEEESATNRLGFYRVIVRRGEEETVALFRGTVYKTDRAFFQDLE